MKARTDRDTVILDAARRVLIQDPSASMAAIAASAGVGMSALYLRFDSKEVLLQALSLRGLQTFLKITSAATEDQGPIEQVFSQWSENLLTAATLTLGNRLAGAFTPTPEHYRLTQEGIDLANSLFERAQDEEVVARSVNLNDLMLIIEAIGAVHIGEDTRSREVQIRLLRVSLAGLKHVATEGDTPSPVEADEMVRRWSSRRSRA